jgi:hypothetical protein
MLTLNLKLNVECTEVRHSKPRHDGVAVNDVTVDIEVTGDGADYASLRLPPGAPIPTVGDKFVLTLTKE